MKKQVKKKFPKKAKLISDGGFYNIIPLSTFVARLNVPVMRRIRINQPELDFDDMFMFTLVFDFDRVYKGYAEYRQTNAFRVDSKSLTK